MPLSLTEEERGPMLLFLGSQCANKVIAHVLHDTLVNGLLPVEAYKTLDTILDEGKLVEGLVERTGESLGGLEDYEIEIFREIFWSEFIDFFKTLVETQIGESPTDEAWTSSHPTSSSEPKISYRNFLNGFRAARKGPNCKPSNGSNK